MKTWIFFRNWRICGWLLFLFILACARSSETRDSIEEPPANAINFGLRDTQEEIREKFYGYWEEIGSDDCPSKKVSGLSVYRFLPNGHNRVYWLYLDSCEEFWFQDFRIDTTKNPMWLDFVGGIEQGPFIFKFEGGKLILAFGPKRPTSFKLEKGYGQLILKRLQ